jgi:hypothetical protein
MKKEGNNLLNEHLNSLDGIQEVGTDEFFYTRLKAKMLARQTQDAGNWIFPLKPVWIVSAMALLLVVNIFILSQQFKTKELPSISGNGLQSFAESYDQNISSY